MSIFKKKRAEEETAVTVAAPTKDEREESLEDDAELVGQKQSAKKKSLLRSIPDIVDTVKGVKSSFDEVYNTWIKPIVDNRAQIKRRWNTLVTAISVVFFLLYVPILLFSKIANGLSLGWDIALYTCIGVYVVAVIVMLVITFASGKSSNTEASKRWRRASSITLLFVRIASLAISITAIIISGGAESSPLDTILMVLAIVSIVFTTLTLIFGGAVGFVKWLISPAKVKRTFSFVALEWNQMISRYDKSANKPLKRAAKKYAVKINSCLDAYLLPALGKKYIKSIDGQDIGKALACVSDEDINMTEWIVKEVFAYACGCGYAEENPCAELELDGDIVREDKLQKRSAEGEKESVISRFASLFKRKTDVPAGADIDLADPDGTNAR